MRPELGYLVDARMAPPLKTCACGHLTLDVIEGESASFRQISPFETSFLVKSDLSEIYNHGLCWKGDSGRDNCQKYTSVE